MNGNENPDGNAEFVEQVRHRAQGKAAEYYSLLHEQRRVEMQVERVKAYVEQLNRFLEAEGQTPVPLREIRQGSPVGKPGNRSKDFPLRKAQWEGLSLWDIVAEILSASPNEVMHADAIAHQIYEIESPIDLRKVKRSLVSTLRRGARGGRWQAVPRNRYRSKATVAQGRLGNV